MNTWICAAHLSLSRQVLIGSSVRDICHLDCELVRRLCLGQHGLVGLLSCGDALGETRDRSQTAMGQVARLATILKDEVLSSHGLTPDSLREWMDGMLETVHEWVLSTCHSLVGRVKGLAASAAQEVPRAALEALSRALASRSLGSGDAAGESGEVGALLLIVGSRPGSDPSTPQTPH